MSALQPGATSIFNDMMCEVDIKQRRADEKRTLRMEVQEMMNNEVKAKLESKPAAMNRTSESMIQMMFHDWHKNRSHLFVNGKYDRHNRAKYYWKLVRKFVMNSFKKNFQFKSEYLLAILNM